MWQRPAASTARVVDVAQVAQHGRPHRPLEPREVHAAELVPLGDDRERVGALRGLVASRANVTPLSSGSRAAAVIDTGSNAVTATPRRRRPWMIASAGCGAQIVGVGLEARPSTPTRAPFVRPTACHTLSTMRSIWRSFAAIVASTIRCAPRRARANDDSAWVSLGKHEPP
jgi:hypothetical protein